MDIKKEFSKRVRAKRIEYGYSQLQFAQLLALQRASIINLEKGRHSPTIEGFYKICCVLECTPNDLLPEVKKLRQVTKETVIVKKVIRKDFKPVKL